MTHSVARSVRAKAEKIHVARYAIVMVEPLRDQHPTLEDEAAAKLRLRQPQQQAFECEANEQDVETLPCSREMLSRRCLIEAAMFPAGSAIETQRLQIGPHGAPSAPLLRRFGDRGGRRFSLFDRRT